MPNPLRLGFLVKPEEDEGLNVAGAPTVSQFERTRRYTWYQFPYREISLDISKVLMI